MKTRVGIATVRVEDSATLSDGNFGFRKTCVEIEMGCAVEEVEETYADMRSFVIASIRDWVAGATEELQGGKAPASLPISGMTPVSGATPTDGESEGSSIVVEDERYPDL